MEYSCPYCKEKFEVAFDIWENHVNSCKSKDWLGRAFGIHRSAVAKLQSRLEKHEINKYEYRKELETIYGELRGFIEQKYVEKKEEPKS